MQKLQHVFYETSDQMGELKGLYERTVFLFSDYPFREKGRIFSYRIENNCLKFNDGKKISCVQTGFALRCAVIAHKKIATKQELSLYGREKLYPMLKRFGIFQDDWIERATEKYTV